MRKKIGILMRIRSRLDKLELITGGCSECGGPPGPDTPLKIVTGKAHPDEPHHEPHHEPEQERCPRCGLPVVLSIRVRGEVAS
jgi:hypothetical protein